MSAANRFARTSVFVLGALVSGVFAAACDETSGTGTVRIHLSAEGPAKTGYPFDDGAEVIGFVDGWSLTYSRVLVSIGGFSLAAHDGTNARVALDSVVADLHLGDPMPWQVEVGARRWDRVGFDLVAPKADARLLEGVVPADVNRMRAGGFTVLVEGLATDGTVSLPFSFGIPDAVRVYDCENGIDGTEGVSVGRNAVENVELTMHLDHLFLDSIADLVPAMRFEPLASRAGSDELLTIDDLSSAVSDIRDRSGQRILVDGDVLVYDPGPFPLDDSRSLGSFVRASATTLGHLNGEGHCRYVVGDLD